MKALNDLYNKMVCELEELSKGELSMAKLDSIDKLAHATKNLKKVIYEEENSQSMSNRSGMHYVRGHYSHDDGMSYMSERMSRAMEDPRYSGDRESMERYHSYR